jgi:hypothetical protein
VFQSFYIRRTQFWAQIRGDGARGPISHVPILECLGGMQLRNNDRDRRLDCQDVKSGFANGGQSIGACRELDYHSRNHFPPAQKRNG